MSLTSPYTGRGQRDSGTSLRKSSRRYVSMSGSSLLRSRGSHSRYVRTERWIARRQIRLHISVTLLASRSWLTRMTSSVAGGFASRPAAKTDASSDAAAWNLRR
jgi:hypothetical protein